MLHSPKVLAPKVLVPKVLVIVALLGTTAACNAGRHSSAGFRLPPDGDVERGKLVFVSTGCGTCHEVSGADMPRPTVQPPVPVVLGGEVDHAMTDGYLVASIVYPSYSLASYPKREITSGGQSRMPSYADNLTVRQVADLVAFLQSRYVVRRLPSRYSYY